MLQNILNYQHFAKHKILVRQNIAKFVVPTLIIRTDAEFCINV